MALDNANFIAELSITDPPGSDPLSQGDDQIRTIKRATFQSWPLVAAAVNLTDVQLNLVAIKNEVNEFTAQQNFLNNIAINVNGVSVGVITYNRDGFTEWAIRNNADSSFAINRTDVSAPFTDTPFKIDNVTGVADFAHVPTVLGAPLWIAGELRMFVAGVTIGTNWFLANGTNGTVDLANHAFVASGSSPGGSFLQPNLVGTAAAGTTGVHALSVGEMPLHNHRIWSGSQSGITDTTFAHAAQNTVAGANRTNSSPAFANNNAVGQKIIEDAGAGNGHTHTSPSQAVTVSGTSRDTVRSLSFVVATYQYVP